MPSNFSKTKSQKQVKKDFFGMLPSKDAVPGTKECSKSQEYKWKE